MVSVMQNQYFPSYHPLANQYFCFNGGLTGGYPTGQILGNYYGYWPWGLNSTNNVVPTNIMKGNGGNLNPSQYGGNLGYPQYFKPMCNQWMSYPYTNWFNAGQPYPQTPYYSYWPNWWNMTAGQNGTYYSWPRINYFQNQMQYPNYAWPAPVYWGVQQTHFHEPDAQQGGRTDSKKRLERKENHILKNTSSDVIKDYHVPPIIARKTVSDIPRSKEYSISLMKSETSTIKGESDDGLPFLLKISDTNIHQIAPSRSFGPSMVYNSESDQNHGHPSSQRQT